MFKEQIKSSHIYRYLTNNKVLLLDGGLSNQLESQGFNLNSELWSADLLISQPSAIVQAHKHYLAAGAQCLITASYQATISGFMKIGYTEEEAKLILLSSIDLALKAIDEFSCENPKLKDNLFVAASVGPYGASLADGSEYHGNYGVDDEVLLRHHRKQISLLANSSADILACETIPSLQEALVLKKLLSAETKPAWISFSCKNGQQLNDGTPIEECVEAFTESHNPIALGVNCTNPKYVEELLQRIKQTCPTHFIIGYPNSGEDYDATTKSWHGTSTPHECGVASKHWLQAGANIIGGCCRMGPQHIASIKKALFD